MNTRHIARKRFSQNFLINEFVIEQIIEIINPQKEDFLIEIGPGLAALTMPLLNYIQKLRVVEIDRDIINYLKELIMVTISDFAKLRFLSYTIY